MIGILVKVLLYGYMLRIETTYYSLNGDTQQVYNDDAGLVLSTSQGSNWMGEWSVNFWSVDNAGNAENKNKPENTRIIKIDAGRPYVEITSPTNEEQVEILLIMLVLIEWSLILNPLVNVKDFPMLILVHLMSGIVMSSKKICYIICFQMILTTQV